MAVQLFQRRLRPTPRLNCKTKEPGEEEEGDKERNESDALARLGRNKN